MITRTINVLKFQLGLVKNDIEKIKSLKQKAMQDPIQYVEGIMAGVCLSN